MRPGRRRSSNKNVWSALVQTFLLDDRNLTPKFAKITRKGNVCFDKKISKCEQQLLKLALRQTYKDSRILCDEGFSVIRQIRELYSKRDYFFTLDFVGRSSDLFRKKTTDKLNKKFQLLCDSTSRRSQPQQIPAPADIQKPKKIQNVVHNLSNLHNLLENGLGFAITQKHIPEQEIKVNVEDFGCRLVVRSLHPPRLPVPGTQPLPPFRPNNYYFPINENIQLATALSEFGMKCRSILRKATAPKSNINRAE